VFARNEEIDMLFVHPATVRQGVATSLCDAIEKLAAARNAERLTVDASDTALDFFKRRGFVAQRRNTVRVGSEWAANTTMEKKLSAKERAS
jgi:putative acetyltransferase